jgi:esterase/lipase
MSRKKKITKLFLSSILLFVLVALILISKKENLIAHKMSEDIAKKHGICIENIENNKYGLVLTQDRTAIPGAVVENIALSVPKQENSDERIIRYGRLVRYANAQGTILICHGFMTDKFDVAFLRHMFPKGKFNFMTFDFRAHGECVQGQRCTFGRDESLDVLTAGHFLKNHPDLKGLPLMVYGFSMGAVASIEAQAKDMNLFAAMILDCPFDSTENIIKKCLESLQFSLCGYEFAFPACGLLQRYAFHPYVQAIIVAILKTVAHLDMRNIETRVYPITPAESAQKVKVPCLFIHCKNDEKVPVDAVKNIYNGVGADYKMLWLTNGRRHFDSYFYNPEKYISMVQTFLEKAVNGSLHEVKFQQVVEDQDESIRNLPVKMAIK